MAASLLHAVPTQHPPSFPGSADPEKIRLVSWREALKKRGPHRKPTRRRGLGGIDGPNRDPYSSVNAMMSPGEPEVRGRKGTDDVRVPRGENERVAGLGDDTLGAPDGVREPDAEGRGGGGRWDVTKTRLFFGIDDAKGSACGEPAPPQRHSSTLTSRGYLVIPVLHPALEARRRILGAHARHDLPGHRRR